MKTGKKNPNDPSDSTNNQDPDKRDDNPPPHPFPLRYTTYDVGSGGATGSNDFADLMSKVGPAAIACIKYNGDAPNTLQIIDFDKQEPGGYPTEEQLDLKDDPADEPLMKKYRHCNKHQLALFKQIELETKRLAKEKSQMEDTENIHIKAIENLLEVDDPPIEPVIKTEPVYNLFDNAADNVVKEEKLWPRSPMRMTPHGSDSYVQDLPMPDYSRPYPYHDAAGPIADYSVKPKLPKLTKLGKQGTPTNAEINGRPVGHCSPMPLEVRARGYRILPGTHLPKSMRESNGNPIPSASWASFYDPPAQKSSNEPKKLQLYNASKRPERYNSWHQPVGPSTSWANDAPPAMQRNADPNEYELSERTKQLVLFHAAKHRQSNDNERALERFVPLSPSVNWPWNSNQENDPSFIVDSSQRYIPNEFNTQQYPAITSTHQHTSFQQYNMPQDEQGFEQQPATNPEPNGPDYTQHPYGAFTIDNNWEPQAYAQTTQTMSDVNAHYPAQPETAYVYQPPSNRPDFNLQAMQNESQGARPKNPSRDFRMQQQPQMNHANMTPQNAQQTFYPQQQGAYYPYPPEMPPLNIPPPGFMPLDTGAPHSQGYGGMMVTPPLPPPQAHQMYPQDRQSAAQQAQRFDAHQMYPQDRQSAAQQAQRFDAHQMYPQGRQSAAQSPAAAVGMPMTPAQLLPVPIQEHIRQSVMTPTMYQQNANPYMHAHVEEPPVEPNYYQRRNANARAAAAPKHNRWNVPPPPIHAQPDYAQAGPSHAVRNGNLPPVPMMPPPPAPMMPPPPAIMMPPPAPMMPPPAIMMPPPPAPMLAPPPALMMPGNNDHHQPGTAGGLNFHRYGDNVMGQQRSDEEVFNRVFNRDSPYGYGYFLYDGDQYCYRVWKIKP